MCFNDLIIIEVQKDDTCKIDLHNDKFNKMKNKRFPLI